MSPDPRITYHGTLVLQALAKGYRYGFDIMDFTGLPSGTAYPILRRFESHKLVRSRWEGDRAARTKGRPRRRYYELTAAGRAALVRAMERLEAQRRVFAELDAKTASSSRSR
jgi:PadR family transcriptional regulator PadR